MTRNVPWSPHRYDSIEHMNALAGPELRGLEHYPIAATKALYGSRISPLYGSRISNLLKHSQNTRDNDHRSDVSINMLYTIPSDTHDASGTEHDGQAGEMTLNHWTNRGADGGSLEGLRGTDGERKNNESGALEGETHDRKKLAMKGPDGIELSMEETLEAFSYVTTSSRGPNTGIAGDDMQSASGKRERLQCLFHQHFPVELFLFQ